MPIEIRRHYLVAISALLQIKCNRKESILKNIKFLPKLIIMPIYDKVLYGRIL